MTKITTHILDTSLGRPAAAVGVKLERTVPERAGDADETRVLVGSGVTDDDGRLSTLLGTATLEVGVYVITFDTGGYFAACGVDGFYPEVSIRFNVHDPQQHYHVPLLLNPFGYSTYRGS